MNKNLLQKHQLQQLQNTKDKFKIATLAGAIAVLIAQATNSYASDIEIYTKPSESSASGVVVMMLDTSGSMDIKYLKDTTNSEETKKAACDLPSDVSYSKDRVVIDETYTGRGYTRNYCYADARNYYYRKNSLKTKTSSSLRCFFDWQSKPSCYSEVTNWFQCGVGEGSSSNTATACAKAISAPSTSGYTPTSADSSNNTYYYKTERTKYYDRISRLKDALYTLATMPVYNDSTEEGKKGIKKDVKIGIGTFPYGSDNTKGYIRIPADTWGDIGSAQRTRVLNLIKSSGFKGQGGTPTSAAYAEAAAYLLGTTTGGGTYSGINQSKAENSALVGSDNKYVSPLDKSAGAAECSGQGIYFLTDGQPQSPKDTNNSEIMGKALGLTSYTSTSTLSGGANNSDPYRSFWSQIGAFSRSLNDPEVIKKALGVTEGKRTVLTSVVGFGSVFEGTYSAMNTDAKNAYNWGLAGEDGGTYGKGGFIAAKESEEIVENLNAFIGKVGGNIPSISTGSSTIPLDALNPEVVQPYSYFPQFEPKVADDARQQLWFGNLKKFHVVNNGVFADDNGTKKVVVEVSGASRLQDYKDIWGEPREGDLPIFAKFGALSKLPLGTSLTINDNNETSITGRNLITDYEFDGTIDDESQQIKQNLGLLRLTHLYTTNNKTKTDNPNRIKGLMGLLGYNISDANQDLSEETADLAQMGSILHSLPVLITQEGKAVATRNASGKVVIDSEDRKDYVLFGTTQGLLHVVDAETGIEKFAFLPKEMAEKQYELFKYNAGTWDKGKNALYYGIDGEWTAHTVYVSKDDGTLTVDGVVRNVAGGLEDEKENLQGKQWVYGGFRMGGRSYYALDLTNMKDLASSTPKIKFHIDPSTGTVRRPQKTKDGKTELVIKHYPAIAKMGQSWSKPKLDYVNWNGKRKLVMFVGGGYDAGGPDGDGNYDEHGVRTGYAGYEQFNYQQTNEIGSGIYMFDADNGDLLWYASKTKHSIIKEDGDDTNYLQPDEHTNNDDLKYSVVSEIKTIDRNNDGIVDHLYFGDLAGQAFRVDLNKPENRKYTFNPQVTRILNLHTNDGTSPRFYLPPVFTAHHSANGTTSTGNAYVEGGNIVIATFISGNKSSPLLATNDSSQKKNSTGLPMDAIYAIYEYDIHPTGQYYPTISEKGKNKILATNATTPNLNQLMPLSTLVSTKNATVQKGAKISPTNGWGGWYYKLDKNIDDVSKAAGIVKGITPLVAMEGNLYATLYDASAAGSTETCGAGVKGNSFTQRICLPSGVCQENANFKYNLGSGIVGLNVGPMTSAQGNRGIIIPDPTRKENIKCTGTDCPAEGNRFIPAGGSLKFIPHRWYERYSTKG